MTQPVHLSSITAQEVQLPQQTQNQQNTKIYLLVGSVLASFVSMVFLPWNISMPLSALFITTGVIFSLIGNDGNLECPSQVNAYPSEPSYYYDRLFFRILPAFFTRPTYPQFASHHAPVGTATYTPIIQPSYSHHAPVGSRVVTPLVSRTDGHSDHHMHAPVGSRVVTPLVSRTDGHSDHHMHAPVGLSETRSAQPIVYFDAIPEQRFVPGAHAPVGRR